MVPLRREFSSLDRGNCYRFMSYTCKRCECCITNAACLRCVHIRVIVVQAISAFGAYVAHMQLLFKIMVLTRCVPMGLAMLTSVLLTA